MNESIQPGSAPTVCAPSPQFTAPPMPVAPRTKAEALHESMDRLEQVLRNTDDFVRRVRGEPLENTPEKGTSAMCGPLSDVLSTSPQRIHYLADAIEGQIEELRSLLF